MVTSPGPGDAALWRAAAAGEQDAFGLLFDRHATAVYNFLLRRTADWSLAEDLTAAVFLLAWRRRREIVLANDSALPWLLGAARLVLRNATRSRARYQSALARARAAGLAAPAAGDPADAIVQRLDTEQQLAELRTAVAGLPTRLREAVELCVYAGLDQREAAVTLGVSVGTVKSRLHRARQRLARDLRAARPGFSTEAKEGL